MRAKDLASLAGTTVRTIRYYHQVGLLSVPDEGTTWRSYGFAHLTRLMRIRWLVDAGVPLAEVPHMLRPPDSADDRGVVIEDLQAVLDSLDAKLEELGAQRRRIQVLLGRVHTEGRLSPLPAEMVEFYRVLLDRPLPPEMAEAIRRERDLAELAAYRDALPTDITSLVGAMTGEDIDELCALWERIHALEESTDRVVGPETLGRITDLVREVVALADRVAPDPTQRLLGRAAELDRAAVRAALGLAYRSPVYRGVVNAVLAIAAERAAA